MLFSCIKLERLFGLQAQKILHKVSLLPCKEFPYFLQSKISYLAQSVIGFCIVFCFSDEALPLTV